MVDTDRIVVLIERCLLLLSHCQFLDGQVIDVNGRTYVASALARSAGAGAASAAGVTAATHDVLLVDVLVEFGCGSGAVAEGFEDCFGWWLLVVDEVVAIVIWNGKSDLLYMSPAEPRLAHDWSRAAGLLRRAIVGQRPSLHVYPPPQLSRMRQVRRRKCTAGLVGQLLAGRGQHG